MESKNNQVRKRRPLLREALGKRGTVVTRCERCPNGQGFE